MQPLPGIDELCCQCQYLQLEMFEHVNRVLKMWAPDAPLVSVGSTCEIYELALLGRLAKYCNSRSNSEIASWALVFSCFWSPRVGSVVSTK